MKRNSLMKNGSPSVALLLILMFSAIGVVMAQDKSITIKGSDTMVLLGQRWAEVYMKKNPSSRIQVTGGGSGTGIAALINGTTDTRKRKTPRLNGARK